MVAGQAIANSVRRRKRVPISCERCRRLKRKCNRQQPCSECTAMGAECIWSGAQGPRKLSHVQGEADPSLPPLGDSSLNRRVTRDSRTSTSRQADTSLPASSKDLSGFPAPRSWSSLPSNGGTGNTSALTIEAAPPPPLQREDTTELLFQQHALLDAILSIWFRELDWMYDIVRGTPFERKWCLYGVDAIASSEHQSSHALLFAICALVHQLMPGDAEAASFALSRNADGHAMFDTFASSCWKKARDLVDAVNLECNKIEANSTCRYEQRENALPLEIFQASLLVCAYAKNTGNPALYRELLYQDIARLQHARIHDWFTFYASQEQKHLAHRIFWAYYTYDRLAIMLAPVPYALHAQHANMFLCDESGSVRHVYDLNAAVVTPSNTPGVLAPDADRVKLSPYATFMVQSAAMAGRFTDRIASLRMQLGTQHASLVGPQVEEYVLQANQELSSLEGVLAESVPCAASPSPTSNTGFAAISSRFATFQAQEIPPLLLTAQRHVVQMTIAKLRRDIATHLIRALANTMKIPSTLERQRLEAARRLLRHAFQLPRDMSMRSVGWSFFLFYVSEPTSELLQNVENLLARRATSLDNQDDHLSIKDDLVHALNGRNLLVMAARETHVALALTVARRICSQARSVMEMCLPMASLEAVADVTRVVEPGHLAHIASEWYSERDAASFLQQNWQPSASDVLERVDASLDNMISPMATALTNANDAQDVEAFFNSFLSLEQLLSFAAPAIDPNATAQSANS